MCLSWPIPSGVQVKVGSLSDVFVWFLTPAGTMWLLFLNSSVPHLPTCGKVMSKGCLKQFNVLGQGKCLNMPFCGPS